MNTCVRMRVCMCNAHAHMHVPCTCRACTCTFPPQCPPPSTRSRDRMRSHEIACTACAPLVHTLGSEQIQSRSTVQLACPLRHACAMRVPCVRNPHTHHASYFMRARARAHAHAHAHVTAYHHGVLFSGHRARHRCGCRVASRATAPAARPGWRRATPPPVTICNIGCNPM